MCTPFDDVTVIVNLYWEPEMKAVDNASAMIASLHSSTYYTKIAANGVNVVNANNKKNLTPSNGLSNKNLSNRADLDSFIYRVPKIADWTKTCIRQKGYKSTSVV